MRYIDKEGPVTVDSITMMLKGSPQNTSAGMKPLKANAMIIESDTGWIPTTFGRTVLAQIEPAE
jgi:predicted transcriptional regulator